MSAHSARPLRRSLIFLTVAAFLSVHTHPAGAAYPNPGTVAGYTLIQDPSMIINTIPNAPRYILYGDGNKTLTSNDRITFEYSGLFMPVTPAWWKQYNPDSNVWAPDVSFHDGKYWLYYAVSTPGAQKAAIGLATSPSGLPGSWTDQGPIITSQEGDPDTSYCALDPSLFVDADGKWWLVFGSHFGGIFMTSLNPATGKPDTNPPTLYHVAQRTDDPADAIEEPFIYQYGNDYYLFASFDRCCHGVNSTYNIRVGRSASPNVGYADKSGKSLLQGGGTTILASHDYVIGPGGQSVYRDDYIASHILLIYHYYDSRINGIANLGINFLNFSTGFPVVE